MLAAEERQGSMQGSRAPGLDSRAQGLAAHLPVLGHIHALARLCGRYLVVGFRLVRWRVVMGSGLLWRVPGRQRPTLLRFLPPYTPELGYEHGEPAGGQLGDLQQG